MVENYKKGIDSLVFAVCGSGKTEISLNVIKYAIMCGEKVGFAVPRRDVVIELYARFKSIFKRNTVISVYGGHNNKLIGDLIILTTHQLYRYYQYFDLLIVDEIDAFPFKDNEVLNAFFYRSIRGHYILMSATPSAEIVNEFKKEGKDIVSLFSRFHSYPLPVPQIIIKNNLLLFIHLVLFIKKCVKEHKPVMVFVPTIEICESTFYKLSIFINKGTYVHSKKKNREKCIEDFKECKCRYIVTTAVLERGVTYKDAQVVVYQANHKIYDQHALVQIAGRAGRKIDAPTGEVLFLANGINEEIKNAVNEIERANKKLQNLL